MLPLPFFEKKRSKKAFCKAPLCFCARSEASPCESAVLSRSHFLFSRKKEAKKLSAKLRFASAPVLNRLLVRVTFYLALNFYLNTLTNCFQARCMVLASQRPAYGRRSETKFRTKFFVKLSFKKASRKVRRYSKCGRRPLLSTRGAAPPRHSV